MRHLFVILSLCLAWGVCFAGSAVYVDDNAPNDPGPGNPLISDPAEDGSTAHPYDSIQQAIDSSDPNFVSDVIILPGTYTGTGNRDIDFKGKPITVRGTNPDDPNTVAATVIDCQGTAAQPHRGFYFHSGETATSVLKGVTIRNGYGGKVLVKGISVSYGGGITCLRASPKLLKLLIIACQAYDGGGVACYGGVLSMNDCKLANNFAQFGGGAYCLEGAVDFSDCQFNGNNANSEGGGVFVYASQGQMLTNTIYMNKASSGGGVIVAEGLLLLESCSINSNTSITDNGGGMAIGSGATVQLRKTKLAGNFSAGSGGAMYVTASLAEVSNCTIAGNRAAVHGGGIYAAAGSMFGASVELRNCIVWGNRAARGNQIACESSDEGFSHGFATLWYSDVEEGLDGTFFETTLGLVRFKEGTIDTDPLFADSGRWDDNGTPADVADDVWVSGDYHLKSYAGRWDPAQEKWVMDDVHSPCIDAGEERGPSLEPAYNGGRVNMGAYGNTPFASKTPDCPARPVGDLDNDCRVTFADLALFAANWLDCNLDPPIACE